MIKSNDSQVSDEFSEGLNCVFFSEKAFDNRKVVYQITVGSNKQGRIKNGETVIRLEATTPPKDFGFAEILAEISVSVEATTPQLLRK